MCTTKNKKTLQKYLLCTPLSTKSIHYFNLELVYLLFGLIRLYLMVDCCIQCHSHMTFVSVLAQIYVKKQKHLVDYVIFEEKTRRKSWEMEMPPSQLVSVNMSNLSVFLGFDGKSLSALHPNKNILVAKG